MKKCTAFIIIIFLLFSSGCVEKKSQYITAEHDIKQYIVYDINKLPNDLITLNNITDRQKDLLPVLFQGLVTTDENGNIVPAIAEKYEVSKDNITYSFKIRQDAQWSDGTSITADDFVDFFSQVLSSKMGNGYASKLYSIYGVKDYNQGRTKFNSVAIRAVNDKTLEVRLNSPCKSLLNMLALPEFCLRKVDDKLIDWKNQYNSILYSGPFQIQKIAVDNSITLVINNNYWDKDDVKSNKIIITASNSVEEAYVNYQNDNINLMVNPPLSEIENIIEKGEGVKYPACSGTAIVFNTKKDGLSADINFRRAVSAAINRTDICENLLGGTSEPASTFVPSGFINTLTPDLSKIHLISQFNNDTMANEFYSQVKNYKNKKLKLVYLDNTANKKVSNAIVKSINFKDIYCYSEAHSNEELEDIVKSGDYDMMLVNYSGMYGDAASFLDNYRTNDSGNLCKYSNMDLDNTLLKANSENDELKRSYLLEKAEDILMNDLPVVPVYFDNLILCKKDNVKGVYVTNSGTVRLDKAYVDVQ